MSSHTSTRFFAPHTAPSHSPTPSRCPPAIFPPAVYPTAILPPAPLLSSIPRLRLRLVVCNSPLPSLVARQCPTLDSAPLLQRQPAARHNPHSTPCRLPPTRSLMPTRQTKSSVLSKTTMARAAERNAPELVPSAPPSAFAIALEASRQLPMQLIQCSLPINPCLAYSLQEKKYRSMQEHIRRAHPEHYIPKLPATEESFALMVNSAPHERPPPTTHPHTTVSSIPAGPVGKLSQASAPI